MREKINRLARGIVDTEQLKVAASPQNIQKNVPAGGSALGEIVVSEEGGSFVKGLAYSSHARVRVLNDAFGGIRCRVSYEVDASWLSAGDKITGSFCLVTNGGEFYVPFSFIVTPDRSRELLESLKTPQDFADIARKDPETALRLTAFQDFTDAPFMQDGRCRALFDGIKNRPDRRNSLEEFLVALKVKEPVELLFSTEPRRFLAPETTGGDVLEVKFSSWGYTRFEVRADGAFLQLPQQKFGSQDAKNGVCRVAYRIDPKGLHGGRNLGALRIITVNGEKVIPMEVRGKGRDAVSPEKAFSEDLARYLTLCLSCEDGEKDHTLLYSRLRQSVNHMASAYGETLPVVLADADLSILEGKRDRAAKLLEEHRGEMAENRQGKYVEYCLYIGLQMELSGRNSQKETLVRLVRKHLEEDEPSGLLFWLWSRLSADLMDGQPELYLDQLARYYARGCRSPFFYLCALRFYEAHPELFKRVGNLELQMLLFAVRRSLLGKELAGKAASFMGNLRRYHSLACRLLILFYREFEDNGFLSALCGMLIRGNRLDAAAFSWYEEAVKRGISLTRLYEYYLATLPKDYPYLLPKEVLLYFSYDRGMDSESRAKLYTNILTYMKKDTPLYHEYERSMEQFAMEQLFRTKVNRRLVVLYRHMIYPEMIDKKAAAVLPSILRSYRIRVKNPNMKYVIVCYEALEGEDAWPIQDGVAYVPLFLDESVILFQDQYGNRYANVPHGRVPAMERTETEPLMKRCFEVFPEHPMLRLKECSEILKNGVADDGNAAALKKLAQDMPLHPLFRKKLVSALVSWHTEQLKHPDGGRGTDAGYLLGLDAGRLTQAERAAVCEALAAQKYNAEAWHQICVYGSEGVSNTCRKAVCSDRLLQQSPENPEKLLGEAGRLFEQGAGDSVILDCLCEHYNGPGETMYRLLKEGLAARVETYDLAERLLAQLLFTGECGHLDEVFDDYMAAREKGETLVRAYFTQKSAAYFLEEKPVQDRVFACLEGILSKAPDFRKIPTLYLLALGRYYAGLPELDAERRALCSRMVEQLLSEGRIFPWFHALGKSVRMPESVMDKTMLEYRSPSRAKDGPKPQFRIRILPQEQEFHPEEPKKVYPGIYVMGKVLFSGEKLEYRVTEPDGEGEKVMAEGSLAPDPGTAVMAGSRFAELNALCEIQSGRDESVLKKKMTEYLTEDAIVEELFPSI